MIDYEKIEQYANDLLTVMGVRKDGEEQLLWLFLHHACCAAAIYEVLDDGMKPTYDETLKRLNYFFSSKISLKQRKRRKGKIPPTPPNKRKRKDRKRREKYIYTHSRRRNGNCFFGFGPAQGGFQNGMLGASQRL